jgi:hypothetical protein
MLVEFHILHSSICLVDLFLELARLLGGLSYADRHLTEDVAIKEDEEDQKGEPEPELDVCAGAHFIASEGRSGVVDRAPVLVDGRNLLEVVKSHIVGSADVHEVDGWRPVGAVPLDYGEPDAADHVQEKDQFHT